MNALPPDAEVVVAKQLDAYNARDIDAFMATWHHDAQYFEHPSKLLASGAAEIRARHVLRFQEPELFGRLVQRFSVGNLVVDPRWSRALSPKGSARWM